MTPAAEPAGMARMPGGGAGYSAFSIATLWMPTPRTTRSRRAVTAKPLRRNRRRVASLAST